MRDINKRYRGEDRSTNVLSFAFRESEESIGHLGELFISISDVEREAMKKGWSRRRELCYTIIHGTLHLLGYDHQGEEDGRLMREKEDRYLSILGDKYEIS